MAGSWEHMTTKNGKLRNYKTFNQLIENRGDAYEAAQECFGMIWYLADQLAGYPGERRARHEASVALIHEASKYYQEGLKLGGVQKS